MVEGKITRPMGNEHPFVMPYASFKAKDGYVFHGGYTDKFWRLTCEFFGEPEFADIPELDSMVKRQVRSVYNERIKPKLEAWIANYTVQELVDGLGDKIPLTPIYDVSQVVKDPQILARGMIIENEYPQGKIGMCGQPVKMSATPADPMGLAPNVGEHNAEVYAELLGFSESDVAALTEKGIL
jgi:CoA:oxalate CoA-transferase